MAHRSHHRPAGDDHEIAIGGEPHVRPRTRICITNGVTSRTPLRAGDTRDRWGADAVNFFDHNFFDREETSLRILDVLGGLQMPWWCYARADTLANFNASTWEKIRRSRLRMAYVGAVATSDAARQARRAAEGKRADGDGSQHQCALAAGGKQKSMTYVYIRRHRIHVDSLRTRILRPSLP
ncbi:MAG TPA: hypothetical protein VKU41_07365, partial [Polyangiaceae bacterium]|nr:hypothetical protein [Polyangiaceae bacterium]